MSDLRPLQHNELKETRPSMTRKPLRSEIIRKRVDQLLQPAAGVTLPGSPHLLTSANAQSNSLALSGEIPIGTSSRTPDPSSSSTSSHGGQPTKGKRIRAENRQQTGYAQLDQVGSSSNVHPVLPAAAPPHHGSRVKSRPTTSSKHPVQASHDAGLTSVVKEDVRLSQRFVTGPLAVAEFERLRKEVQMLRDALHESKKTAKHYHKKLEETKTEITTALSTIKLQDTELITLKSKNKVSQEMFSTIEASVQCQICIDLPDQPYALAPCGHVLCLPCLQEWFRKAPPGPADFDDFDPDDPDDVLMRAKTCPACRALVRHRPVPVFMVKAVSAALKSRNAAAAQAAGGPTAATEVGKDPWEGIFPSSDESDEGYYDSDEDLSEDGEGLGNVWYNLEEVEGPGDESDDEHDHDDEGESGDDEDEDDLEEADSSSEEEWRAISVYVPPQW